MIVRGFLAGGFWGVVVGGAAVAAASLVNPPPKLPQAADMDEAAPENTREIDSTVSVDTGQGPAITAPVETADAPETPVADTPIAADAAPDAVEAPATDAAPVIETVEAEEPPAVEVVDATAADVAENEAPVEQDTASADNGADATSDSTIAVAEDPAEAEVAPSDVAPVAAADDRTVPNAPDEGVAPATVITADDAPTTPDAPAVVTADDTAPNALDGAQTDPAAAPQVADTATLEVPTPATNSGAQAAGDEEPVVAATQPDVPTVPETDAVAGDLTTPIAEPEVAASAPEAVDAPTQSGDAPELVAVTDSSPLAPQSPVSPADPAASDSLPGEENAVETLAQADNAPVVSVLPGGDNGVRVNRLTADGSDVTVNEPETEGAEIAPLPDDAPAVQRYAAVAENPDALPELSIVLADDGSFDGAIAAISGLPFPVSVMLNPSAPDAADRMAAYRAAGIEVGMLVSLPPAAQASDVAIYFEAAMTTLPEAFAILDATGDTQGDADVIRQTISVLAEDGQGLITVPRGLNTAPRVAAEAGVAAGVIFRDLDGEGQNARTIQRFMDQAAFRAGQTPGVMMLGRVQAETISALTRWGTQSSRARQVAVVPASAVLTAE